MNFDELFTKWKSEYSFNAFIRDGIVDPAHYDRPHILFILRDMNCRHERDLCADLRRDGSGWRTWNNIGRWTKALLDGDGEYPWDMSSPSRAAQLRRVAVMNLKKEGGGSRASGSQLLDAVQMQHGREYPWDMSSPSRAAQLRRVAVMNLKKEGGGSRASGSQLLDAVQMQHGKILEEICLCDPGMIICCGLASSGIKGNAALLKDHVLPVSTEWASFQSRTFDGMIICCGLASSGIKGNAALLKDHVLPVSTEWASFQSRTFDRDWQYYFTEINKKQIPVISFCHPQVTNLNGSRGHEKLFIPLFQDMLYIKELFLKNTVGSE